MPVSPALSEKLFGRPSAKSQPVDASEQVARNNRSARLNKGGRSTVGTHDTVEQGMGPLARANTGPTN